MILILNRFNLPRSECWISTRKNNNSKLCIALGMVSLCPFKGLTTNIHFRIVFISRHHFLQWLFHFARTSNSLSERTNYFSPLWKSPNYVTLGHRMDHSRVRTVSSRLLSVKANRIAAVQCRPVRNNLIFFHFLPSPSAAVIAFSPNSQLGQNEFTESSSPRAHRPHDPNANSNTRSYYNYDRK